MLSFLLSQLEIILQKLPPEGVKAALDGALDGIEDYLAKGGLTPWEKVVVEGIKYIRRALAITEEEGGQYADVPKPPKVE